MEHASGRTVGLRLHSQEPQLLVSSETFDSASSQYPPKPLLLDCLAQLSLFSQVAELQEQVTTQSQEQAILQRSLQDKAAEVEVERLSAKV